MESSSLDNFIKRSLDVIEVLSDEQTVEKRSRIESESSDVLKDVIELEVSDDSGNGPADLNTEVIYELSPENEEFLSSIQDMKSASEEGSPRKSEENEGSDKNDEIRNQQESEGEESEENVEKREGDGEESSGKSDDSDEDSDDDDDEGDSDDSDDNRDNRGNERGRTEARSDDDVEQKTDSKRIAEKLPNTVSTREDSSLEVKLPSTIDGNAEDKGHLADSKDEDDQRVSELGKMKEDEQVDGDRPFGKPDDYSKKSVEDLEDLQEDIHKELAQITGKSKRKHKKASSSSHREKRHKDKSNARHKEREASSKNWDNPRKDYEKKRKHHRYDVDEKWSQDARRGNYKKMERRDREDKSSWTTQARPERSPKRVTKINPQREDMEMQPPEEEQPPGEIEPSGAVKETAKQKSVMSDSMREMIRASMRERKPEQMKNLRGFSREVIDSESDESAGGEDFLESQMSDVSSASSSSEEMDESSPEVVPKLPRYLPAIHGCRSVEEFQWLNRIEEGTYGVVYRAKDRRTGEIVALKKLKMEKEKEGFPITSLREINTLLKAQHPNIVTVQEIVVGSNMDKIYIVMDFVEHDLKALMETMTQSFLSGEIKTIMIQLLRAVNHLHDNWILHRDIKTSNLLLSNKGILKVGDFGLAREYGSPLKPYTPIVVTLWYRAPELLLGVKEYSTPIDLWSVGCVFAELLTMKPLFNGQSEISQINKIFKELGTPSDKIWPGPPAYSEMPATKKTTFAEYPYNNLRNRFGATLTDNGFDLLNSFLTYDPNRRITAEDALKHEYFNEAPSPVDPSMFPSWPARSEGAKRVKKASPKAPEGGNFYKTLSGDGDGPGFHIPVGKSKGAAIVPGFTLKF